MAFSPSARHAGRKMHFPPAIRPLFLSQPTPNRASRCYASVNRSISKQPSGTTAHKIHNHNLQRRWHNFSATQPTHQSSSLLEGTDAIKPGQRISVMPGGVPNSQKKKKKKPLMAERPFVDRIHLKARGGSGGGGCISYHRIGSYKKKPCGGHGGRGGNVYLVTDPTLSSLKMESHHFAGVDGGKGGTNAMQGKNGKDTHVRVPCGVVVRRVLDWEEIEEIYAENGDAGDAHLNNHAKNSEMMLEHEEDETGLDASSYELDSDGEDDMDTDSEEEGDADGEKGEDFDTYIKEVQSSKRRQRKRARKPRGGPSDYEEVVNQEVRSDDGMFHWSAPEITDDTQDSKDQLASTAYPGYDFDAANARKTKFVADLDQPHASLLIAHGGKAGVGNLAYANRPHFSGMEANASKKTVAEKGESIYLQLELKLIADVGLVGFPNAGKSSLLSAMSRASPKIASYPFTTLHPLVGSIQYRDGHSIVMADVPGLIDGAAEGRGRGIEFLRHIERTKALVYMVDVAGVDGRDPVNDLRILGKELREYGSSGLFGENEMGGDEGEYGEEMRRRRREIMNRPSLILANKMDLIPEEDAGMGRKEELLFQLRQAAEEVDIVCDYGDIMGISAGVTGEGLRVLSKRLRQVVEEVQCTT